MLDEDIQKALFIFLSFDTVLLFVFSIFLNRYFIRKKSGCFINIICIFLWFTILLMVIIFPFDLFSNYLFEDNEVNKNRTKIFSSFLYWTFLFFGFILVDQIKNYISNGNFSIKAKILSMIEKTGKTYIFLIGIGYFFDLILDILHHYFNDSHFLIIVIKTMKTLVGMPMLIAYMMFLGCALGDIPKDLFIKYNYPLRIKKLCWSITHTMRKYKKETEFLILSINKIKLTLSIIKKKDLEEVEKEKSEIKKRLKNEENEEMEDKLEKEYDSIEDLIDLYDYKKEMEDILNQLEQTVNYFNINIPLDSINNNEEKRPLKDKKELISIHETFYIYKTQIFRINYQKYEIYKEWAEIKTFMINKKNDNLSSKINNDIGLDIENINNIEKSKENEKKKFSTKEKNEFQKVNLNEYKSFYYKYMPAISIILIILCLFYDFLIIEGQLEYIFKWDFICGKIFRTWFTSIYLMILIRLLPMYFNLFAVCYAFSNIKSDMTSYLCGHKQTEPSHALFFVGTATKLICPLCYNFIKIMYSGVKLEGNNSRITQYFTEQFGFLEDENNIVIFVVKITIFSLFIIDIILNVTGIYGTIAYKKYQFLSYNARYLEKELEIDEGEGILNEMNQKYGGNFEKIKEDYIVE